MNRWLPYLVRQVPVMIDILDKLRLERDDDHFTFAYLLRVVVNVEKKTENLSSSFFGSQLKGLMISRTFKCFTLLDVGSYSTFMEGFITYKLRREQGQLLVFLDLDISRFIAGTLHCFGN